MTPGSSTAAGGHLVSGAEAVRHPLTLRVQEASFLAEHVLGLTLVDPAGAELPAWTPGAHIDLVLPSGMTRSYSLCGEPGRAEYRIAVLNEPAGRGASREIHDVQLVGMLLPTSVPRNQFELVEAAHYVFIAGGIGVTPLVPMVSRVAAEGRSWEMHYLGRSRSRMSFLAPLTDLAARSGGRLDVIARDERERVAMRELLEAAPTGSAVFCCGPDALIREVEDLSAALGSRLELHVERFGRPTLPEPGSAEQSPAGDPVATGGSDFTMPCDPDASFTVEMRKSGFVIEVGAGESILGCARKLRQGLTFSCSDGYCGTCETAVLAGTPDHRDTVLSDDERSENKTMMICVGRSRTRRLALDL